MPFVTGNANKYLLLLIWSKHFTLIPLFSGPESDYRNVLKEDGQEILMMALSSLEAAVGFLEDGSIEFQTLSIIREHSKRFLLLSEQISKQKSERLKMLLDQRSIEQLAFLEEREKVSCFIRMCSLIKQGNRKTISLLSSWGLTALMDLEQDLALRELTFITSFRI